MSESIIVALITGGLSLLGVYFANRKGQALVEYKLQELSDRVAKHNSLVERTYELEKSVTVIKDHLKRMEDDNK